MVKPGAVVIDVGTEQCGRSHRGDADFAAVIQSPGRHPVRGSWADDDHHVAGEHGESARFGRTSLKTLTQGTVFSAARAIRRLARDPSAISIVA
jgi:hypothetical protein